MFGPLLTLALFAMPVLAQVVPPTNPAPAPSTSPLPSIGRVRATVPACAVTRDLVIPSFAAARRGDADFAQASQKLRRYVQILDDDQLKHTPVYREAALAHLDMDLSALMKDILEINKALGDARFANLGDPQVVAMHAELNQLYGAQATRANELYEFVTRQRVDINKTDRDLTDNSAFTPKSATAPGVAPSAAPMPGATFAPLGMPELRGIGMTDVQSIDGWANGYSRMVRSSENEAAKTFLPIAQACVTEK